ncbi:helix-turn-helix transcriptional regulator [Chromobacterium haemolyticum]|uniref:Helix-turn-helix transcriptional regulator n=1 Tax=Chromobacterium fluminis TaxID=3044269 RepID=A0ABX0LA13_9NEIS|nr:helix-turn-helix transcriptional regulator [Chromobacterium haemolyticum]
METFAERVRRLKERRGVTVEEIAFACAVTEPTVYGWLKTTMPRNNHLASLATFLDVTVDHLVHGDRSETRDEIVHELRTLVPQLSNYQLTVLLMTAKEFAKKGQ